MLHNSDEKEDASFQTSIPPKLKLAYQAFKLVAGTSTYKIFEAEACDSKEKHRIRVLDRSKDVGNKEYNLTATLFVKELLQLQSIYPGSILADTFEISDDGQQIGCATLSDLPLSCQLEDGSLDQKDPQLMQNSRSEPQNLSNVEEQLKKDAEIQDLTNPGVVESKQTEEIGMQVTFQSGHEEVKQAQSENQEAPLPLKKIITGKLNARSY